MALAYCSTCRHDIRDRGAHLASAEHRAKLHPVGSKKGARASARRARDRYARHTLTKAHEREMWDLAERQERADKQASGRHFYGAWSPWGVSAFMGGGPGRGRAGRRRRSRRRRSSGSAIVDLVRDVIA